MPFARVERGIGGGAPVEPEAERADRHGAQAAAAGGLDPQVLLLDRQVGQGQIVVGRAADRQVRPGGGPLAHDLAPVGGQVYGADQECHRPPLTSSRTR
ncbi:hypothetical protein J4558_12655 [Leptolyngbya sp. 15MV]|nr:hypothetical protein J4558_12655 [Leptolyngbya sp. 15MV]